MADPSISIAMCTYNGRDFVEAQLDSFVRQTRRPDELVVCDDASVDGTGDLVEAFSRTAPFEVRLIRHPHNVGRIKNFEHAIGLCSKEIIFLSDQDDVWHADKIETTSRALRDAPEIGAVCCDADVVDANLRPLGCSLWEAARFPRSVREGIGRGERYDVLIESPPVQGAALAFRARYRPLLLPLSPEWGHDCWIAAIVAACSRLRFLDDRLLSYRQHQRNLIGLQRRPSRAKRWARKLADPRRHYRTRLQTVEYFLRQMDDLEERLMSFDERGRLSAQLDAIERRRRRLQGDRRLIAGIVAVLGGRSRETGTRPDPLT